MEYGTYWENTFSAKVTITQHCYRVTTRVHCRFEILVRMLLRCLRVSPYTFICSRDRTRRSFLAVMRFRYRDFTCFETPLTFHGRSAISEEDAKNVAARKALTFLKRAMQFEIIDYHYEELQRVKAEFKCFRDAHANCNNSVQGQMEMEIMLASQSRIDQVLRRNEELETRNAQLQTQSSNIMNMNNQLQSDYGQIAGRVADLEQENVALMMELQAMRGNDTSLTHILD